MLPAPSRSSLTPSNARQFTESGEVFVIEPVSILILSHVKASPSRTRITGAVQLLNKQEGSEYTEDHKARLTEMLQFLERSIESMYVRQQASGLVSMMYKTLQRVTVAAVLLVLGVVASFSVYWFSVMTLGAWSKRASAPNTSG